MDDAYSEFKNADPVKFEELIASLKLDYEEGWTMKKNVGLPYTQLIESWNHSPNEHEV